MASKEPPAFGKPRAGFFVLALRAGVGLHERAMSKNAENPPSARSCGSPSQAAVESGEALTPTGARWSDLTHRWFEAKDQLEDRITSPPFDSADAHRIVTACVQMASVALEMANDLAEVERIAARLRALRESMTATCGCGQPGTLEIEGRSWCVACAGTARAS